MGSLHGESIASLDGHSDEVTSVASSPDGMTIATGSLDGTVKIWDTRSMRAVLTLEGHEEGVTSIAYQPREGPVTSIDREPRPMLAEPRPMLAKAGDEEAGKEEFKLTKTQEEYMKDKQKWLDEL